MVADRLLEPAGGRARWTLELLADALVKATTHESLSRETVRRRLAENKLKPWRKDMCVHSPSRRGLRRPHGGRARSLRRSA